MLNSLNQIEFGDQMTPLHFACLSGNRSIVELLVNKNKKKIKVNELALLPYSNHKVTPLHIASEKCFIDIVDILLNYSQTNINATTQSIFDDKSLPFLSSKSYEDAKNFTALHYACKNGSIGIVRSLLKKKEIKITIKAVIGDELYTPFQLCAQNGYVEIAQLIYKFFKKNRKNMPDQNDILNSPTSAKNLTPLHLAVLNNQINFVSFLCQDYFQIVNVNQQDSQGLTPLYYACKNGFCEIVKILVIHPKIKLNMIFQRYTDGGMLFYIL